MAPNQRSLLLYENDDLEKVATFEKKGYRTTPILYINGERVSEELAKKARSNQTLLSFLRDAMRLTGSKLGCAEGGCGACTVMISKTDKETGSIKHISVNACLMPVLAADGCHITTVEGIGTVKNNNLHPIQKAMTELHGSQCGFCTPGIIVSIYALYANNPSVKYIEEHLDGNLCRCTGYRPIWDAARSLCDDAEELVHGPCGTACRECPEREECEQDCNVQEKEAEAEKDVICCSSSKDKMKLKESFVDDKTNWIDQPNAMFPKELLDSSSDESTALSKPLMVVDQSEYQGAGTWFKPSTLVELLALLKEFGTPGGGGCKIVVGNTEVGIETKFKHAVYPRLIFPSETVESLYSFTVAADQLVIGACVPLSQIQHKCESLSSDSNLTKTVMPIRDMLRWFASTQIRNVACLGGNLVTASPISDMNPMLASMGAKLVLSKLGDDNISLLRRSVPVSEFFLKYRTVDLDPAEIVERVEVPVLRKVFEYVKPFKQARRREDDISIVTSGMRIRLAVKGEAFVIEQIDMAFGGMAPKTIMASETMESMTGAEFNQATFVKAAGILVKEMKLPETVPGGQAAYRMTLAASFLYKFFLSVVEELKKDLEAIQADPASFPSVDSPLLPSAPTVDEKEASGTFNFLSAEKPSFAGNQMHPAPKVAKGFEEEHLPKVENSQAAVAAGVVGNPTPHMSGSLHCTGEALYTDDIPQPPGTLQATLILSNECGAVLEALDVEPARGVPGVVGVYTAEDIELLGGKNLLGAIVKDEVIFLPVGEKVRTVGQVLGVVVAESLESAEAAARKAVPTYGKCEEKIIVTVADAIEANSFYDMTRHVIERGDPSILEKVSDASEGDKKVGDIVKVSGSFSSGAQEHFYLETNSTLAIPSESDTNLTIYCSTQAVTKTHTFCSSSTGTPASKVVVRMKRMGGAFGGKETRSVHGACVAAIAAKRSSRPVRLTLPRDVDMSTTGTRHVFVSKYTASAEITQDGAKLVALDIKLYNNGGSGMDLSGPIADRALFHVDNCYNFPNIRAEAVACKTVQAPHTAFRGFGGPQGMAACEHVMEHLAMTCNVPMEQFRRSNMYKNGEATPFGSVMGSQGLGKWNVPTMWDRLYRELDVPSRRAEVEEFNAKNKWLKRGIALLPTKFGIAFTAKFMNQGGALVHLYTDGTVLVSHGGTEMGQGLHTKVCQVAAQAFGIPVDHVYVNDSSSDKVANSIATAASMSTDMYGMATLDACRQILSRLAPYREKLGSEASLAEVAMTGFMDRIDLSAHGFFVLDSARCGYDFTIAKPDNVSPDVPENSWKGQPFNYFTQGVAYAEVEVDLLSGNHRTIRSDVLVDVGSSINPAIDIGQIEGAFIQGMGWSTIEEVVYADDDHTWVRPRGKLFTTGPGTYKIPAFNDVPETFNVSLLEDVDNPFAVHSSKAIGEPPFYLGTSVFYAIKDAIRSVRKEGKEKEEYFEMRMPATSERIRLYSNDELSQMAKAEMLGSIDSASSYQPQGSY